MISNRYFNKSSGFTLLEVLVSLIILAIGLLGIAGLQVTGLMNNNSSAQRSQATALASEFADILRSNKPQVEADKFGTTASDGNEIDTSTMSYTVTASCESLLGGCTTNLMAETDLRRWKERVESLLPSGVGTSSRVGDIYTVTLTWVDDKENTVQTKSFSTSFMP
jgi:type IV pilus assembly protein PilV